MSERKRAVLCFLGFLTFTGVAMSNGFRDIIDSIPESLSYFAFIVPLAGVTLVGFYSWWQHYHGRKLNPTVERLRKRLESPAWWNWPF